MRQFSILRYLKKFSLLIFLLSVIGSLFIYFYAKSQQRYVASTVIQYTNSAAKEGYTPDGSPLNVEEIYSSTVIDAAMADLGFHSNIDSVRSNCYVEEVVPETQQKLNEALVEKGEDPSYVTDTYRVYFIGNNDTGEDYAWNMLDAIIKNYYEFYAGKYVEEPLQGNGVSVLAEGNYDYVESTQVMEDSISEMLDYLLSKREDYPYFRSVDTGYTYNDLYRIYRLLYNYEIPGLYAAILSNAETNDSDLLVSRLTKDCEDLQLYIENRQERSKSLKKLIDNYSIRNKEMMDYHYQSAENGTESILKDVEYNHEHSNKETTYDGLIQEYVDLNIDVRQKTIEKEHKEYLLSVFEAEDHAQGRKTFSSEEIREKINRCAELANKYYQYVENTGRELNRQLSANYLAMISSINVQPTVNIKLYLVLAIILFVLVGGIGAVLLGRALDFIDYFRYVDKTVQIPNRARCDVYISEWANKLLDENFACVALKMDSLSSLSNEYGREAGDEVLKDFAAILKSYGDLYGFVGHNGSGVFYAFFPKCPPDKLDVILKAIGRQVEKYNNLNQGHTVHYISGKAVSSEDHIFEIRDLLRLALQRMHSEQNEAESEDVSGKNAPEKTRNRTKPVSTGKKNDAQ
ncbi:GGDEF domain-containing protein [Aristaeella hokkaidonensis]|uniref:GGDEF domain-containing protein n=1 Tax=Aristaeella hokkaidonensis TaxID=3046382 RepID=A0AC61MUE0_9FIRM|nr:diguanylate cyclase [Aristaeella hokkaidonensis]QUC65855.1 GGDEF domain-containing protein [Aristaeella hokkaidonensis]SNT93932.1 GGDEF domain-containing protein, diguanylate cyclase (c-di-GMP synthetase) or its enzymatically inactive variants [Aristaeella hokkaidonensis]